MWLVAEECIRRDLVCHGYGAGDTHRSVPAIVLVPAVLLQKQSVQVAKAVLCELHLDQCVSFSFSSFLTCGSSVRTEISLGPCSCHQHCKNTSHKKGTSSQKQCRIRSLSTPSQDSATQRRKTGAQYTSNTLQLCPWAKKTEVKRDVVMRSPLWWCKLEPGCH